MKNASRTSSKTDELLFKDLGNKQFDEFSNESFDCFFPDYSHQWTSINYAHYNNLSNCFYGD